MVKSHLSIQNVNQHGPEVLGQRPSSVMGQDASVDFAGAMTTLSGWTHGQTLSAILTQNGTESTMT